MKKDIQKTNVKENTKSVRGRGKITVIILAVLIIIASVCIFVFTMPKETGLMITDKDGNGIIEKINSIDDDIVTENGDYFSYIDIALSEAVKIIGEKKGLDDDKALDWLIKNGCTIETAFDTSYIPKIGTAFIRSEASGSDFGFVMTDIDGRIICSFSSALEENFATIKTQPYSSLKPLSVYTPALENGVIHYSSMFFDSPYKNITGENGETLEWPQNGTGYFSYKDVSLFEAIGLSLNTVAVKCLVQNSVYSSLDFLQNKLGADVSYEIEKFNLEGEDGVLSQLALGYLIEGFSPLEMAGYYQMFANGGKYTEPYSVISIKNSSGKNVYTAEPDKKQVISEESAYIMNKLLLAPITNEGTARKAALDNIPVIGKTGTGDDYLGCWFTCLTPEYAFAFWHSGETVRKNVTTDIFASFANEVTFDESKEYPKCDNIKELSFCAISGKIASESCPIVETGYYSADAVPENCSLHN